MYSDKGIKLEGARSKKARQKGKGAKGGIRKGLEGGG